MQNLLWNVIRDGLIGVRPLVWKRIVSWLKRRMSWWWRRGDIMNLVNSRTSIQSVLLLGAILTVPMPVWGEVVPTDREISSIRAYSSYGYIRFTPPFSSLTKCNNKAFDSEVVIDWNNNRDAKTMFATALMAFATGKKVGFSVRSCHKSKRRIVVRIDVAN